MRSALVSSLFVLLAACSSLPPQEFRFASQDGVRVHYSNVRSGPRAVVFVHGWALSSASWREQVPMLADVGRLIAIDLPGHGNSDKPEREYSMAYWAQSIDAVLRDAGVVRAILVGHSNGVPVVREFYRQFPAKTEALVAVDGALSQVFAEGDMDGVLAQLEGDGWRDLARQMTERMVAAGHLTDAEKRWIVETAVETPQHVMIGGLRAASDPAVWRRDRINVPVLGIYAKQPVWSAHYYAGVRGFAPQFELVELEDVNHCLMVDEPERFNAVLRAFCARVRDGGD